MNSDQSTETPRGIDAERVNAWFGSHVANAQTPLSFVLVAGGRSNLTFVGTDMAGTRFVLRRPPTGHLLPKAHDMSREYRIISALDPAGIPVPPAIGLCEDSDVNGAPFYVMGFVDGVIARDEKDVAAYLDEGARRSVSFALVDTLADIHNVSPDACGLGDLGRRDGYIARQLHRWYTNYQAANQARGGTALQSMTDLHERLSKSIPDQGRSTIVHGDYRLDNCVVSPDGSQVLAVLDWELCTLGDPLADLGQLLAYWTELGERSALGHASTAMPGFARRQELVERYAERTGADLSSLGFYVAFAYWKLACILEGVYARYVGGAMGDDGFDSSNYPETIRWLAARSENAAAEAGL